jgi:ACS family hexuronate transporter-like MFS transporter
MDQSSPTPQKTTNYRWMVCFLLFLVTTVNYMDRSVLGFLKPTLEKEMGWDQVDYSNMVVCFQLGYALSYLLMGRLIDRIGVRHGLGLAVILWSLASMAHGFMGLLKGYGKVELGAGGYVWTVSATVLGFMIARFALGLAEGGNFPGSIKGVSEWFPKKERALATGLFNTGSNVGALMTPMVIPLVVALFNGWQAAFFTTAALDFCWLILWYCIYQSPDRQPRVSAAELAYIRSDPVEPPAKKIPWIQLLSYRPTWAFTIGMLMTSPIWWFYLFWIPDFFNKRFGLDLQHLGPPIIVIYLMSIIGSIGGGWISSTLIKRGFSINFSRKTAMLICALCVVPVFAASQVENMWMAVILLGLATAAHQGFSANLFTLVSDTMPKYTVSSVVGIGGMAGAVGAMGVSKFAGYVLKWTNNNYLSLFIIAASAYLVALLIIHLLVPRIKQE